MAEIIEARVKQKTGTEADFAGFTLLDGEMALVRSSANGPVVNFKVGPGLFDSLPWSLDYASVAANYKGNATPATDPGTPAGPEFYTATEVGTYTNFDGIEVEASDAFVILSYDGAAWSKGVANIDLSSYALKEDLDSVQEEIEDINTVLVRGNNLIDNSKLVFGYWKDDGSTGSSVFMLRTPYIPITGNLFVTLSGAFPIISSAVRFVYFDHELQFISFDNPSYNAAGTVSQTPVNAAYIGVTIAYSEVMGPDPTNTQFKETVMLNYGSTAKPWEPYQLNVPVSKIIGLSEELQPIIDTANDALNEASQAESSAVAATNIANSAASVANQALAGNQTAENNAKAYTDAKIWPTENIQDEAVTMPKLSPAVIDYIDASGGGTINNAPDDEDIASVNNLLKFKDGAEGFHRIRTQLTYAALKTEIETKAASGYILIKDILDFDNAGVRGSITIPDGTTVRFVGNGRLKNVRLNGKNIKIEAGRKRVFENVELFMYTYTGATMPFAANMVDMVVPDDMPVDLWDIKNGVLIETGTVIEVNPFHVKPFQTKKAGFTAPELSGGNWIWKDTGGVTRITFETSGPNIILPISDRFIFFDSSYNVLSQGSDYDPATVRVGYISRDYGRFAFASFNCSEFYPEWWGVSPEIESTDFFNRCLDDVSKTGGGTISLAGNQTYHVRGGLIARNDLTIAGHRATIALINNAADNMFIYDPNMILNRFNTIDLILDGNKDNQVSELDGIHLSWLYGEPDKPGNGYCWDNSTLINTEVRNFSRDGFSVTVPGDVTGYSFRAKYNARDGIFFNGEHFKQVECIAWGNGRYGMYAKGALHFRITAGAYAHNYINNMRLEDCAEFQIVSPSSIDCMEHGIYLINCTRAVLNSVRVLTSGRAGIYLDSASRHSRVISCLDYLNNRKDVAGTPQEIYNSNLPVPDNRSYDNITVDGTINIRLIGNLETPDN